MDYKKKYKEEVVRATQLWECGDITRENLEYIFPELKESEDEKIRELLINLANQTWDGADCFKDFSKEKILSWLEKHGEPTDINPSEFDLRLNKLLKQFETLPKEELVSSLSFYLNVVQNDGTYKDEEKQGEQKHTDKAEPKFKVGDWVVQENIGVYKVIEVCESWYEVVDNKDKHYSIGFDKEYMCHLYTIKDAKDGDVLATPNYLYIFNSIDKETETVSFYCLMKKSDEHFSFGDYKIHDEILNSTPATKEQRDLLFAKMKEAGYKWGTESKELKEIKQKSAEWSEEDEIGLGDALWCCKQAASIAKDENDMGNVWFAEQWLKSLKDRVQPQPKQEWSKEDDSNWNNIWDVLDGRFELSDYGYKEAAKWFLENCPKPPNLKY